MTEQDQSRDAVTTDDWDVIIVGAGPAGLSAALLLGRCRRRVVVFDDARPRNFASTSSHGFFTRDGAAPDQLRKEAREQLRPYGVLIQEDTVMAAKKEGERFVVVVKRGERHTARAILLATGLTDDIPEIEGIERFYGRSVFHCPFCDGWEWRDKRLVAYCNSEHGVDFATGLTTWSRDVVLCTDGVKNLPLDARRTLDAYSITLNTDPIARLEGGDGRLDRVVFRNGSTLDRDALFFKTGTRQRSELAKSLGCEVDESGMLRCDMKQRTRVSGLHVAGDCSQDLNLISIAAAEGTRAAVAIHNELKEADAAARRAQPPRPSSSSGGAAQRRSPR